MNLFYISAFLFFNLKLTFNHFQLVFVLVRSRCRVETPPRMRFVLLMTGSPGSHFYCHPNNPRAPASMRTLSIKTGDNLLTSGAHFLQTDLVRSAVVGNDSFFMGLVLNRWCVYISRGG